MLGLSAPKFSKRREDYSDESGKGEVYVIAASGDGGGPDLDQWRRRARMGAGREDALLPRRWKDDRGQDRYLACILGDEPEALYSGVVRREVCRAVVRCRS